MKAVKNIKTNALLFEELQVLRDNLKKGDNTTQEQLDRICIRLKKYKEILLRNEKDEIFVLVDSFGNFKDLTAPRWLCHLLGLRHKGAHVLLKWKSPSLGNVYILQVRSWTKSDSPGHLDISVGGHTIGSSPTASIETAYQEMQEELGISRSDLINGELIFKAGYESYNKNENENFYNSEWRDVYFGEITTTGFDNIRFNDKEVVALYLCPESEANELLNQKIIPIASALELSLPLFII